MIKTNPENMQSLNRDGGVHGIVLKHADSFLKNKKSSITFII
jgi:hypothetical protein